MYKKTFLAISLTLLVTMITYAQDSSDNANAGNYEFSKNVIHGSISPFIIVNTLNINYDRLLATDEGFFKAYYGTARAGIFTFINFAPGGDSVYFPISLGVTGLSGSKKDHFELSLGVSYFIDKSEAGEDEDPFIDGDVDLDDSFFIPNLSIGYRKQLSKGGIFRAGLGWPESLYVGWGYSF